MTSDLIQACLAFAPSAAPGQQSTAPPWAGFVMPAMLVFVFYFVFIRPQQKKAKDLQNTLSSLRSGDKIVTSSGIVGTVISVKEKTVSLRSADTKLEILKSAVSEITERAGAEATPSNS
jgi:preprotein translocase subunit YajC